MPQERPSTAKPLKVHARRWFSSLLAKFLLILTPVFLLLPVPGVGFLVHYQLHVDREMPAARIGNQTAHTAAALERYDFQRRPRLAQDLIAPLAADRAFLCAELRVGADRRLFVAQPPALGCRGRSDRHRLALTVGENGEATLLVRFTDDEMRTAERLQGSVSVSVVAFAFLLALAASAIGFRLIVGRPLGLLLAAIRQSAETGERRLVKAATGDELGTVIDAYNAMLRRQIGSKVALARSDQLLLATEALQDSEERYCWLVELSPDGVVVHTDGNIVFANSSLARILGAESADDLLGSPMDDFHPPDELAKVRERRRQAEAGLWFAH